MTIKIPQMKKGKGYITAEKTRSEKPVTYGDPFKSDCIGNWEMKVVILSSPPQAKIFSF